MTGDGFVTVHCPGCRAELVLPARPKTVKRFTLGKERVGVDFDFVSVEHACPAPKQAAP